MNTLQVSLAAGDLRHARHILPHQLKTWACQVNEILLVVDTHRSRGRFDGASADESARLDELLATMARADSRLRIVKVDYRPETVAAIGEMFFDREQVPAKDFRGGPFYSYFFALWAAQHDFVMHVDSDILFGGASPTWLTEAHALLAENSKIVFASPLPGPPAIDGMLHSQAVDPYAQKGFAFQFSGMSTRLFFTDRRRLSTTDPKPRFQSPTARGFLKAVVEGNPAYELPEVVLSRWMNRHQFRRVDFLGDSPGMWSLHPPFRSERFYAQLPQLIDRVESDDLPDEQRGHHDVADCLIDWTDARLRLAQNRWWKRLQRRLAAR